MKPVPAADKITKYHWAAIWLATLLVWGPLAIQPAKLLMQGIAQHFGAKNADNDSDYFMKTITILLAAGGVAVAALQAWIFERQRKLQEGQHDLMVEQAEISKKQGDLEYRRFIAENRPRLVVRHLSSALHFLSEENVKILGWYDKPSFFTSFSVTNIGGALCKVTESRVELVVWPRQLVPIQFGRNSCDFINGVEFPVGHVESRNVFAPGVHERSIRDIDLSRITGPAAQYDVVLCGSILYVDENETARCTAFWRKYEWGRDGFSMSQYSSVEYED